MPRVVEFTIPAVPPSVNVWSRQHWSQRARMIREWRGLVGMFAPRRGPKAPEVRVPAAVTLEFVTRQDADNCAKAVLDGLVYHGFLLDDGPRGVSSLTLTARRVAKGEVESTRILLVFPVSRLATAETAFQDARSSPNAGVPDSSPTRKGGSVRVRATARK